MNGMKTFFNLPYISGLQAARDMKPTPFDRGILVKQLSNHKLCVQATDFVLEVYNFEKLCQFAPESLIC